MGCDCKKKTKQRYHINIVYHNNNDDDDDDDDAIDAPFLIHVVQGSLDAPLPAQVLRSDGVGHLRR